MKFKEFKEKAREAGHPKAEEAISGLEELVALMGEDQVDTVLEALNNSIKDYYKRLADKEHKEKGNPF